MTTVFIHGVPDTAHVWSRLMSELGGDEAVALSLPGFGCACPSGFSATKEDYLAWLIAAIEEVPPPRDLVAHDWGSILMMRVLSMRADLVRSWVGGGAPFTADYTWHPTARLWQTPGAGEKAMDRLSPDLAVDMLMRAGLSEADARQTAGSIDARMKGCILSLYRSGRDVFREWGTDLTRVSAPGLVLWGEADIYADARYGARIGEITGARSVTLDCGHWWQLERPEAAASLIRAFWRDAGF